MSRYLTPNVTSEKKPKGGGVKKQPELKVREVPVSDLIPYVNNAKIHTNKQVEEIIASIDKFGFCDPIGVWHNDGGAMEIVDGHGRVMALKKMGIKTAPVIYLDHMTDEDRRSFTHVKNQTELSTGFDRDALVEDMDNLNLDWGSFGFDEYLYRDMADCEPEELDEDDEYQQFVDKFKPKKTTDDCYTPPEIYDVIADWVNEKYGVSRDDMVRPFYPGGDFESFNYPEGCCVVDNPPFSILAKIKQFYLDRGIPFFIFAPTLTCFSGKLTDRLTHIVCDAKVTYENGAVVPTSFVTNMGGDLVAESEPELSKRINEANERRLNEGKTDLPKYEYPDEVITAAKLQWLAKHGTRLQIKRGECVRVSKLDAMQVEGIYGGLLLSERAAAERAAAERAAATKWKLSEREIAIVRSLGD